MATEEEGGQHARELAEIVRGMAVALLGSLLGGGLGFLFLVVFGRTLPQAEFGLLVLAVNLLNYTAQLTLAGADYAAIRFVAAARSPGEKRGAMVTPIALALAVNAVVAAVVAVAAQPIAVHALGQPGFVQPLRALAVALPLTVTAILFAASTSGLELARGELVRKVAEQGGRIVFVTAAVVLGVGLTGKVFALAAAAALAVLATGVTLLRVLPRGGTMRRLPLRPIVSLGWPQTVANTTAQLWAMLLLGFVSTAAGARGLAVYGAAVAIGKLPQLVYNSFAYRFTPAISRLWEERNLPELAELLRSVTRWVAITAVPLYAVAIALPGPLLRVFGNDFQGGSAALALVAGGLLVDALAGPVDRALIMTGNVRFEMWAGVVTALATVGPAFVLTRAYGVTGAALTLFTYNTLLNALKIWFVRRRLGMTPVSRDLLGPLAAGGVASLVAVAAATQVDVGVSLAGGAALAAALIAVYAIVQIGVIGISAADRSALKLALRAGR